MNKKTEKGQAVLLQQIEKACREAFNNIKGRGQLPKNVVEVKTGDEKRTLLALHMPGKTHHISIETHSKLDDALETIHKVTGLPVVSRKDVSKKNYRGPVLQTCTPNSQA